MLGRHDRAEMGAFGLSIPEEYGGYGAGGESEYIGMVVATEELSWGSLGVSENVIEASWEALVDSLEYAFQPRGAGRPAAVAGDA